MQRHQDEDESFVADDVDFDSVDWAKVKILQQRFNEIDSIADDDIRLEAARKLVADMNHG